MRVTRQVGVTAILLLLAGGVTPPAALAVLDIGDQGPLLDVASFRMRVTNAGIVGNAFYSQGRSFDPSFEYPAYSGYELLNYAALWVGGRTSGGVLRVSGGPLLEWRPTLSPDDRVLEARRGRLGSVWLVDDDGDGRIDEETLDGVDDDLDGEIDEDLGLTADQLLACTYVDDTPEAIRFTTGGETHMPLGLTVHQEVMGWGRPEYNDWAAVRYVVKNHSSRRLTDVYIGLLVDLDSRFREDRTGHLNDVVDEAFSLHIQVNEGLGINTTTFETGDTICCGCSDIPPPLPCIVDTRAAGLALHDGAAAVSGSQIAVVPLHHTTDPLAMIPPAASLARAPARMSFRRMVFSNGRPGGQGGIPTTDLGRYAALAGELQQAITSGRQEDFVVLVSCGPFAFLDPGQELTFELALVAAPSVDSLTIFGNNALRHHYGIHMDRLPDVFGRDSTNYNSGRSGLNGHESCIAAPPGHTFQWDPHCLQKYPDCNFRDMPATYTADSCIWTDADCDPCTGFGGRETAVHWPDPGAIPPPPRWRVIPGDHEVRVEWDNSAEVLLAGGQYGTARSEFVGYRIYRIDDWSQRVGLLPERRRWSIRQVYSVDTLNGAAPLVSAVDSTIAPERILFEQKLYPPGRYRFVDETTLNGFDYVYVLTAVYDLVSRNEVGNFVRTTLESALSGSFDQRVRPRSEAVARGSKVWVVPNPYRGAAAWERAPVGGDARTRHVDFMGLPRGRATIKVWTVAGDLVAVISHEGVDGNGQAPWDLVSRNGQDVESGIYLFTVDSSEGVQRGRFVVIR